MKIRSLHPDFFTDGKVAALPMEARLLFSGLWCHSDDFGRGRWLPKKIEGDVFPHDDVDIRNLLTQLADVGLIRRYEVDGEAYFEIPNWEKYQSPKYRATSSIPEPGNGSTDRPGQFGDNPGRTAQEFGKGEGEGEGEGEGVTQPKGCGTPADERTQLFEAFYQAWHNRPWTTGTKLTKAERGRINQAVKQALADDLPADEILTRASRYRRDWPAIECTPQALLSNWTRFDAASEPPPPFDPANCEHPENRRAEIEGDTYCGACGEENP